MRHLITLLAGLALAPAALAQLPPCDVTLTGTPMTCPGTDDATLTVVENSGGPYTYEWSHDLTETDATATLLGADVYSIYVTDGVTCETFFDTVITEPFVEPLGTITTTNISCAGASDGTVTFTINPGGLYVWSWVQAPGVTATTLVDQPPGEYTVVITGGGPCPSFVNGYLGDPGVGIEGTTDYCPSDPPLLELRLDWGFDPDIIEWSTGDTGSSLQIAAGTTGQIDVTATDTIIGCVATAQVFLNELPSPTVAMAAPDTTCVNVRTLVNTVATTADSLVWRWADSGFSNELNPLVNFTQAGWNPVSVQPFDSLGCGGLPVADSIYAQAQVPAIMSVVQLPCTPYVDIVLGSTTDSCAFFIGDSLLTNVCSSFIRSNMERYDVYTYTFYATQANGCDDTTSVTVDVRTEPTLFLANAFTPNGDGINDLWPVRVDIPNTGFELRLFDRWGVEQWATVDPQAQWDGTFGGGEAPLGVYVYTMKMRDPCEPTNEITSKGHVTLFR